MNWHLHKCYNTVLTSISDPGIHYHSYGLWRTWNALYYNTIHNVLAWVLTKIFNQTSANTGNWKFQLRNTKSIFSIAIQIWNIFLKLQYFLLRKNWRSQTTIKRTDSQWCSAWKPVIFSLTKDFAVSNCFDYVQLHEVYGCILSTFRTIEKYFTLISALFPGEIGVYLFSPFIHLFRSFRLFGKLLITFCSLGGGS